MTFDAADDLVVASAGNVARFDPAGTLDTTFGQGGLVQVNRGISDVRSDSLRRTYVLQMVNGLLRLNVDGTPDASFASNTNISALSGDSAGWQAMSLTDGAGSSAYLLGGVLPCDGTAGVRGPCTTPATTALIAKVMLVSNGSGGGGKPSGGGGAFAGLELCG